MRNRTYFCPPIPQKAWVAELVDALDSKSSSLGSAGSIPAPGTKSLVLKNGAFLLLFDERNWDARIKR